MLWPLVLPLQITVSLLAALVALLTTLAPAVKWERGKMFRISLAFGCLALIPSCTGIMAIIDAHRFGTFRYDSVSEVNDIRVARYLPAKARNIRLKTFPAGHCASTRSRKRTCCRTSTCFGTNVAGTRRYRATDFTTVNLLPSIPWAARLLT